MNAIQKLIDHCHETYPHLEDVRGQADILAAQEEVDALEIELARLRLIESPTRDIARTLFLIHIFKQGNLVDLLKGKE